MPAATKNILTKPTSQSNLAGMQKQTAREKVVTAAQQLMVGQGYTATTVDEIVNAAGVAKGSFYHAFKSKEDLALAALDDYFRRGMAIIGNGPYLDEKDPVKKVFAFLDYVDEKSQALWEHGCLLGSMSIELADTYPNLIDKIDQLFSEMEGQIRVIIGPALRVKGIKKPGSLELARHLVTVFEGSIIMSRSHRNPKYLQEGIGHYRRYFACLVN